LVLAAAVARGAGADEVDPADAEAEARAGREIDVLEIVAAGHRRAGGVDADIGINGRQLVGRLLAVAIGEVEVGRRIEEDAGIDAGDARAGPARVGVAETHGLAAGGAAQVDADRGPGRGRIGDIEIVGGNGGIDRCAVEIEGHGGAVVQADIEVVEGQRRARRAGNIDTTRRDALQVDRAERDRAAARRGYVGK
jgi:hypothetical protein